MKRYPSRKDCLKAYQAHQAGHSFGAIMSLQDGVKDTSAAAYRVALGRKLAEGGEWSYKQFKVETDVPRILADFEAHPYSEVEDRVHRLCVGDRQITLVKSYIIDKRPWTAERTHPPGWLRPYLVDNEQKEESAAANGAQAKLAIADEPSKAEEGEPTNGSTALLVEIQRLQQLMQRQIDVHCELINRFDDSQKR